MENFGIELGVGTGVRGIGPCCSASGIDIDAVGDAGLPEVVTPASGVLAGVASDPGH